MYLELEQIAHRYGRTTVLPSLSMRVARGEFVCLLGPSGSGKTTLLRLIAGLEPLQEGRIALGGRVLDDGQSHLPPEARGIGMVFQQPSLFPTLTVANNVGFGLRHLKGGDKDRRIAELLEHVGLAAKADAYPHQLSGGQQHRVALARSLAPQPQLLLLDEPFSHLDPPLRAALSAQTRALAKAQGLTCLLVTHDAAEAMRMGDRLVLFDATGHVRQSGTAQDMYRNPADAYVAQALGEINLLAAVGDGRVIRCGLGEFPARRHQAGAVTLGVRPQDFKLNGLDEGVAAQVESIVTTGPEDLLHLRLEKGVTVRASVLSDHSYRPGDRLGLTVAPERVHVFRA